MTHATLLCLDDALNLARATFAAAERQELKVAVAVVDTAGHPVVQLRMDGAFAASTDAALAKAKCAALYQRPTSAFAARVRDGVPLAFLPHVIPLGGGVLLKRGEQILGCLGISGAVEETETRLAEAIAEEFDRQNTNDTMAGEEITPGSR